MQMGYGIIGALAASMVGSSAEIVVSRCYRRPSLRVPAPPMLGARVWSYSALLLVATISMRGFTIIDLLMLKWSGHPLTMRGYTVPPRVLPGCWASWSPHSRPCCYRP